MKQICLTLLVIYAAAFNLACPQKSAIRRANEASYQLAGSINDAQKAVEQAFNQHIIGTDSAIRLNGYLKTANDGSIRLTQAVETLRQIYSDPAQIPRTKLDALNLILSEQIITPVLRILDELKIVGADKAPALFAALGAVKTLIVVIAAAFPGHSNAVSELNRRNFIYV